MEKMFPFAHKARNMVLSIYPVILEQELDREEIFNHPRHVPAVECNSLGFFGAGYNKRQNYFLDEMNWKDNLRPHYNFILTEDLIWLITHQFCHFRNIPSSSDNDEVGHFLSEIGLIDFSKWFKGQSQSHTSGTTWANNNIQGNRSKVDCRKNKISPTPWFPNGTSLSKS